ncbi:hypothetical protein [Solwaraspora sp. WMMA2101]|uniref:hypothetical protein n=1 Tax=Solwaraspora sp. WMMA2101 TaxID=3404124 RepID=UPI003B9442A3
MSEPTPPTPPTWPTPSDGSGRRAQLVLTVANIDTAAVASASITPGTVTPTRDADDLFWCLDLAPVVARLAAQVGATHLYEPDLPDDPVIAPWTDLPKGWQPDLPAAQRLAYEAQVIADEARDPWHIWLGRSSPPPTTDPSRRLAHLCHVAEQLCLDLVIEARRLTPGDGTLGWDIRFELPDGPVGDRLAPWSDLAEAAVMTTVGRAAAGLAEHGRHAPAHHITPARDAGRAGLPRVDVDQLERRILADCTALLTGEPTAGGHAIWRDNRWWHTTLRTAGEVTVRAWQPPPPSWQGPPIPYAACPTCPPVPDLARCRCPRLGGCRTCHGTHRIFHAASVTIVDGAHRARHLNWPTPATGPTPPADAGPPADRAADPASPAPAVSSLVRQLPPEYRLRPQLTALSLDPDDCAPLIDAHYLPESALLDGYVTLPHPDADPLQVYLRQVAHGQPAGRVFVQAAPPYAPPLSTMVTIVHTLGLHVVLCVADHRANTGTPYLVQGLRWGAKVTPPHASIDVPRWTPGAHHRTVAQAVDQALRYLRNASDQAVPAEPATPIPAPAGDGSRPSTVLAGPESPEVLLSMLAGKFPGVTVTVVLTPDRCAVHLPKAATSPDRQVVIAAATLAEAVTRTLSR